MSRRVITSQLQAETQASKVDTYFDKVLRYIPADVVALWTLVINSVAGATSASPNGKAVPPNASGVATGEGDKSLLWIAFVVFIGLTAVWTWMQTRDPNQPTATKQIVISTIAFVVWVFALGEPFLSLWPYYSDHRFIGSLVLMIYIGFVGRLDP